MPGDIRYDGKTFVAVRNDAAGEVSAETVFEYHQDGNLVWGTYRGGDIRFGMLIATVDESGRLDMRYQHVNTRHEMRTGVCRSTPETLDDGRLRLHETWRWTSGDGGSGTSVVEERRGS